MRPTPGGQSSEIRFHVMLLTFVLVPAWAQEYSIDWHTTDGGGGTSTGEVYAVSRTIGRADAGGGMTGGTFSLQGGFWALPIAPQTTDAPTLSILPASPGFSPGTRPSRKGLPPGRYGQLLEPEIPTLAWST